MVRKWRPGIAPVRILALTIGTAPPHFHGRLGHVFAVDDQARQAPCARQGLLPIVDVDGPGVGDQLLELIFGPQPAIAFEFPVELGPEVCDLGGIIAIEAIVNSALLDVIAIDHANRPQFSDVEEGVQADDAIEHLLSTVSPTR